MEDFEDMVAGPSASLFAQDEAEAKLRACIAALEFDDAQAIQGAFGVCHLSSMHIT